MLSQHDLPVWARIVSIPLFIGATWYVLRHATVIALVGESLPLAVVGVVGGSMILGMRIPLNLWPPGPKRKRFSPGSGLVAGFALSLLVFLSIGSDAPKVATTFDRGALVLTVLGGVTWALGVATIKQLHYLKWYGVAVLLAIVPEVLAYSTSPGLEFGPGSGFEFGAYAFFAGTAVSGFLVTQELAFRRILVGDPARAGLLAVLGSAIAFGLWQMSVTGSVGSWTTELIAGLAAGFAGGSLFVLSESLLVSAVYFGLLGASERAYFGGAGAVETGQVAPDLTGIAILFTVVVGVVMGWLVYRKNGWAVVRGRGGKGISELQRSVGDSSNLVMSAPRDKAPDAAGD